MKAICNRRCFQYTSRGIFIAEKGEVVDYIINDKGFVVKGWGENLDIFFTRPTFFNYFKVLDVKMSYSDFEYILCNYIFTDAVLFPNEYSGVHHLIIQGWGGVTIIITVNKEENIIRVSFDDKQEKYISYEEALDGIRNHNRQ